MMKNFIGTLILGFILIGCKESPQTTAEDPVVITNPDGTRTMTEEEILLAADIKPLREADKAENRSHAAHLIENRIQKNDRVPSILAVGYRVPEFIFDGDKINPAPKGYWLKFDGDHTFSYGTYDRKEGSGRFHYDMDANRIIMLDDDETKQPEEWELLTKDDVIVFVGRDYFGNNPRQMKTQKSMTQPTK